ncbi:MAG: thymidine phosphorylase [Alphaproteobacteria bacterium]|nr:thymidine phosphorylase [Alphaproteobacteria bacterium]
MIPQEIIRKTRNKIPLAKEEIDFLVQGIADGSLADIQAASFTMAVYLNGLTKEETLNLTLAMRDSGEKIKFEKLNGPIVDKHSTGGVGDKVSLMLAPMLASCGAYVPMIAGRGLGHTGGTLDKLDSLSGYKTSVDVETFKKTVEKVGCAIVGQTSKLAPADKKLYAIRDVCATVESIPLITASILSKKLAAGLEYLVMDIKCGNGAFMESTEKASELAKSIVNVANGAGTKTTALLTDMNSVLGLNVGNVLELKEALDYLQGKTKDKRLDDITKALCCEILLNTKLAEDEKNARSMLEKSISKGIAYEYFEKMAASLGADVNILKDYENKLPKARFVKPIYASQNGYVAKIDTRSIGLGVIILGGGRTNPTQSINYTTGFTDFCQIGDYVDNHTPLCFVHAEDEDKLEEVSNLIQKSITITSTKINPISPIIEKIC